MFDEEKLKILDTVQESSYKIPIASVVHAEYLGKEVIAKKGGAELLREADTLLKIASPHIPQVIEYGELEDGSNILLLNKLEGSPLGQLVELQPDWTSRTLDQELAIRIVNGLADCFIVLREAGYLYRDLNFNHIIVNDMEVGLVDHEWDVRLSESDTAVVDSLAGTWETMAPEEYQVGNNISEASNIFTLGTVLMQLVTGKSPFYIPKEYIPEEDTRRAATLELMRTFVGVKSQDSQMDLIVNTCLHTSPADRFKSLEDFKKALESKVRSTSNKGHHAYA